MEDLAGMRFGRLVVIRKDPERRYGKTCWFCRCDCGTERSVANRSLTAGLTKSCGCRTREATKARSIQHGMTDTPEHHIWRQMIQRCTNPNNKNFKYYGGRGIAVCDRWRAFSAFYADMGPKPSPSHTVERKDANGNYEPNNCVWATRAEQNLNTRAARYWIVNGEQYSSISSAAEANGVSETQIYNWCRGYRKYPPRPN